VTVSHRGGGKGDHFFPSGAFPSDFGGGWNGALRRPLGQFLCATVNENFLNGEIHWNFTPVAPLDHFGTYNWYEDGPVLTITQVSDTPEPAMMALVGLGLIGIMHWRPRGGPRPRPGPCGYRRKR
jgi:PEP-CTERM motif